MWVASLRSALGQEHDPEFCEAADSYGIQNDETFWCRNLADETCKAKVLLSGGLHLQGGRDAAGQPLMGRPVARQDATVQPLPRFALSR